MPALLMHLHAVNFLGRIRLTRQSISPTGKGLVSAKAKKNCTICNFFAVKACNFFRHKRVYKRKLARPENIFCGNCEYKKKLSGHVFFFPPGNASKVYSQLAQKEIITRHNDFFLARIYRKKKLHDLQHTPISLWGCSIG